METLGHHKHSKVDFQFNIYRWPIIAIVNLKIKLKIKCFKISNVVFSISFLFTFLCLIYYEYIFLYILKFVFCLEFFFYLHFFISISNFFFISILYFLNLPYFNFKILITLLVYHYGNDGPP